MDSRDVTCPRHGERKTALADVAVSQPTFGKGVNA